jgi:ABC-type phosphate/phosphonate transport system substrate-binding protein
MVRYLRSVVMLLVCSALALYPVPNQAEERGAPLVFAVLPSAPPVAMHTLWFPLVARLSRETGLDLRLKVYDTMAEFEADISRGGPDFLFSSPLQAVVAHATQGYVPLVRGSTPVAVEVFVRADSPILSPGDLAGKTIAFVGSKNL